MGAELMLVNHGQQPQVVCATYVSGIQLQLRKQALVIGNAGRGVPDSCADTAVAKLCNAPGTPVWDTPLARKHRQHL